MREHGRTLSPFAAEVEPFLPRNRRILYAGPHIAGDAVNFADRNRYIDVLETAGDILPAHENIRQIPNTTHDTRSVEERYGGVIANNLLQELSPEQAKMFIAGSAASLEKGGILAMELGPGTYNYHTRSVLDTLSENSFETITVERVMIPTRKVPIVSPYRRFIMRKY